MKCSLKLMAPISVKTVATTSIGTLSKNPMLASCVDKPPVASVEKLWLIASNRAHAREPVGHRAGGRQHDVDDAQSCGRVRASRGVNRSSFNGPAISAL